MDRISGLPLGVLHHILSYLPETELAYTFVLSKHWNSVRTSYPVLEFKSPLSMLLFPVHDPRSRVGLRRLLRHVDNSLQNLVRRNLSIERFRFTWFLLPQDSLPLVDTWLTSALHNGVLDIHFHVHVAFQEPTEVLPYPLSQTSFARNSPRFFRLETLTLTYVYLSERIVGDIIKNCPAIRRLSLDSIRGLKTLTISNLDQLVTLTVSIAKRCRKFDSVSVNAPSLEHFSFYTDPSTYDIDLIRCDNLRKLEITRSSVSSDRFNHQISRCPLLELLDISLCNRLKRIRLPLQRLKHLRVSGCHHIRAIEIDSPALSTFDFAHCDILQDFPTILSSKLNFSPLEPGERVSYPRVEVGCVDLTRLCYLGSCMWVPLLAGLLSSCRPRIVLMTYQSVDEENCVKVFCKLLQHTERDSERHFVLRHYRCRRLRCKCWHRRLKDVNIESIGSDGEIKHKFAMDRIPSIPGDTVVRFRFDWDLSGIERFGSVLHRFSLSTFYGQKDDNLPDY